MSLGRKDQLTIRLTDLCGSTDRDTFHSHSIIFQKRFLAFAHSSLSARLQNILRIHGLEDKICREGDGRDIDADVDWEAVRRRTVEAAGASGEFLLRSLREG